MLQPRVRPDTRTFAAKQALEEAALPAQWRPERRLDIIHDLPGTGSRALRRGPACGSDSRARSGFTGGLPTQDTFPFIPS